MKRNLFIPKTALAFLMALFSVWGWGQTTENFETGLSTSGYSSSQSLSTGTWTANSNSLLRSTTRYAGSYSCQIRSGSNNYVSTPSLNTCGTITFWFSGGTPTVRKMIGSTTTSLTATPGSTSGTFTQYTVNVNDSTNGIIISIYNSNSTSYLDDFIWTGYTACTAPSNPTGIISGTTPACTSTSLSYTAAVGENTSNLYWQTSATGTSTSNIASSPLTVNASGTYFVRAFVANCWSTNSTTGYTVDISSPISIGTQPTNQTAIEGATANFTVTATNAASYQWQVNDGNGFVNVPTGGTSSSYTTPATTGTMNGYIYQVIISNTCGSITSSPATLTVNVPPSIPTGTISGTTPACTSTTLTYTHGTNQPEANVLYYWQTTANGTSTANSADNPLSVSSSGSRFVRARNIVNNLWSAATPAYTVTINTTVPATVTSNNTSIYSYNSATLYGNVTALGTCPSTVEKGFTYSTTSGAGNTYPVANIIPVGTAPVTAGAYTLNLGSLSASTTYYYRSYIKDINGIYTYSSAERTFTTLSPATQLVFENVPTTGTVNTNLSTFTVKAVAANGTTVDTGYTETVTLTKASGTGNMTGTTLSVSFTNGIATFADVKFNAPDNYTISAISGTLPVITSANITLSLAPETILAWNFTGQNNTTDFVATTSHAKLDLSLNKKITRGPDAGSSAGSNSFRTTGFKNDGISVNNADYFQTILKIRDGYKLNLTSITGIFSGTTGFFATPGVTSQFAYSFDNVTYTLINNPNTSVSLNFNVNLSSVAALQNLSAGTTIYFRYYASGQTSTGGWGFNSPSFNDNGLEFKGIVATDQTKTVWDIDNTWTNNAPVPTVDAVIKSSYSTLSNPTFDAKNITIQNGGVLEITDGNTINAVDVTVEDGGNLIQRGDGVASNNVNNGVLTFTGVFKANKNYTTNVAGKYAFWSSPVQNQNMFTAFTSQPTDVTTYNTVTNYYDAVTNFTNNSGKGYSILMPVGGSAIFTGTPNNGNINVALSNASFGFNLVGNPYPSNLSLTSFLSANNGNISPTLYFWDNTSAPVANQTGQTSANYGYATFNASGTGTWAPAQNISGGTGSNIDLTNATPQINPGQGFIVKSLNGNDLVFNNDMRVSAAGTFVNKNGSNSSEGKYWLKLKTPLFAVNTLAITYGEGATNALEGFDSKAMALGSDAFYSKVLDNKLAIQGRADFVNTDVVPLGSKHFTDGLHTISLANKTGIFNNGQAIYLHDKVLGTYTNLQNTSYNFTVNAGEIADRFEVVYQFGTLSTSEAQKGSFEIYRDGNDFFARNSKNIDKIEVFDASGRKVQEITSGSQLVRIPLDSKGFYIIKAKSAGKEYTKKLTY